MGSNIWGQGFIKHRHVRVVNRRGLISLGFNNLAGSNPAGGTIFILRGRAAASSLGP